VLDELQLIAEEEVRAFHIYSNKYRALNSEPEKPSPVKQGWEFTAYLLVSLASVLLASMRTAEIFYKVAVSSSASPIFGYIEAFMAIFTVEAGIVVYAAVMASRSRKVSPWVLTVGIILLASISIIAGLAQSLSLATDIDPQVTNYVQLALTILIGPGASIAALIGGHILGQQIAVAAKQYEDLLEEYDGQVEEYNIKLKKSWERSEERKSAKKNAVTRIMMQEQGILLPEATPLGLLPSNNGGNHGHDHSSTPVMQEPLVSQSVEQEMQVIEKKESVPVVNEPITESAAPQKTVSMKMPASDNIVKEVVPENEKSEPESAKPKHIENKKNGKLGELDNVTVKEMQHAITKWLIDNKRTPFDLDLDVDFIAKEVKLDPKYVEKIIQRMKVSYSKRL
jgi:hypothetical protein